MKLQQLFMGEGLLMTKTKWHSLTQVEDLSTYMKKLIVVACKAMGLNLALYSLSGKKASKGNQQTKLKFPIEIIHIAKSTFSNRLLKYYTERQIYNFSFPENQTGQTQQGVLRHWLLSAGLRVHTSVQIQLVNSTH